MDDTTIAQIAASFANSILTANWQLWPNGLRREERRQWIVEESIALTDLLLAELETIQPPGKEVGE